MANQEIGSDNKAFIDVPGNIPQNIPMSASLDELNVSVVPDDPHARGLGDALRDNSLKAAGIGFLFADAALFTSGMMSGQLKEASGAVAGWTAGVIGARYGRPKQEKQLAHVERHLGEYLRTQGIEIPKDPTTQNLTKQGGVMDGIESFLYDNPSQMMNVCYSVLGVQFMRSAVEHNKKALLVSGGLLLTGALTGLLVHERKPDPENPPQGVLQKALSWVQEKPLRVTGTLFNVNQIFLAMDALHERKVNPAQKSYIFKLLAVAGFTFGNTMMAMTSKSHGGGGSGMEEATQNKLAETAAHVINSQPQEVQDSLMEHIAGYLATQSSIGMNAKEISVLLHTKLAEMKAREPALYAMNAQAGIY